MPPGDAVAARLLLLRAFKVVFKPLVPACQCCRIANVDEVLASPASEPFRTEDIQQYEERKAASYA